MLIISQLLKHTRKKKEKRNFGVFGNSGHLRALGGIMNCFGKGVFEKWYSRRMSVLKDVGIEGMKIFHHKFLSGYCFKKFWLSKHFGKLKRHRDFLWKIFVSQYRKIPGDFFVTIQDLPIFMNLKNVF